MQHTTVWNVYNETTRYCTQGDPRYSSTYTCNTLQVTSAITFSCLETFKVSVNLFRIKYQVGLFCRDCLLANMRLKAVEERPTLLLLKVYAVKRNLLHQPFTRLKASTKDSPLISTKPENGANIGFHMILSHLTVKIVFSSPPTPSSLHNNPFPSILGLETSHRGPLDQYLPSLN